MAGCLKAMWKAGMCSSPQPGVRVQDWVQQQENSAKYADLGVQGIEIMWLQGDSWGA